MKTISHFIAIVWLCAVAPALGFIINPFRFVVAGGGGDTYFSSVVLLAHFNGAGSSTTFTDSSSYARTLTSNGGAALSTTSPKFGSASLLTDGVDDYASAAASADFSFGTGTDFTIEFWLKSDSSDSTGCGVALVGSSLYVAIYGGTLYFGNGAVNMVTASWSGKDDAWQFVLARRSGSTCELFINGTSQGTYGSSVTIGGNQELRINQAPVWGAYGKGYVDDLRITNGVARANAVPTAAHPDS
jgi:hypothetical protein